jgi:hypothetical protein
MDRPLKQMDSEHGRCIGDVVGPEELFSSSRFCPNVWGRFMAVRDRAVAACVRSAPDGLPESEPRERG